MENIRGLINSIRARNEELNKRPWNHKDGLVNMALLAVHQKMERAFEIEMVQTRKFIVDYLNNNRVKVGFFCDLFELFYESLCRLPRDER